MSDILLTIDTHSNPKISEWCQKYLFTLRYCWMSDTVPKIRYLHSRYLTINVTRMRITHGEYVCTTGDKQKDSFEHIDTHDYFNNNVIKELPNCD